MDAHVAPIASTPLRIDQQQAQRPPAFVGEPLLEEIGEQAIQLIRSDGVRRRGHSPSIGSARSMQELSSPRIR
jgi:hypothetical protein